MPDSSPTSEYSGFQGLRRKLEEADSLRRGERYTQAEHLYRDVVQTVDNTRITRTVTRTRQVPTGSQRVVTRVVPSSGGGMGRTGMSAPSRGGARDVVTYRTTYRTETYEEQVSQPLAGGDPVRGLRAGALLGLGLCSHETAQHADARRHYADAIAYFEPRGASDSLASLYWLQGLSADDCGEWGDSVDWYRKAEQTHRAMQRAADAARMLQCQGLAYLRLRNFALADELLERARKEAETAGDRALAAELDGSRAVAADWQGRPDHALTLRVQSLREHEALGDWRTVAVLHNDIADGFLRQGRLDEAEERLDLARSALERLSGQERDRTAALLLHTGGEILLARRQWREALGPLEMAYEAVSALREPETLAELAYFRGRAHRHLGETDDAWLCLGTAIDTIEGLRRRLRLEELRAGFLGARAGVYGEMVALLIDSSPHQALHYAEKAKARTFLDTLGDARPHRQIEKHAGLYARLGEIQNRIDGLQTRILRGGAIAEAGPARRDIVTRPKTGRDDSLQKALREATRDYEATLLKLKTDDPEAHALESIDVPDPAALAEALPSTVAVAEFFAHEDELFVFLVRDGDVVGAKIEQPFADVAERVARVRGDIEALADPGSIDTELAWLAGVLLGPVAGHLKGVEHLVVVPHGRLHLLPFHALRSGDGYLVEHFAVSVAPSLSVLALCLRRGKRKSRFLAAIGNPDTGDPAQALPGSEAEVERLRECFPATYARTGPHAKKAWVARIAPRCDVLHMACHALFVPEAPMFSFLQLAAGGDESGRLTARETLEQLEVPDLVALSACQTAVADVGSGDEIVSLTRAFFSAGAASVVASLWSAEDVATQELMARFYAALHDADRAQALRAAQRALLADTRFRHPAQWAAFTLAGDWRHRASAHPPLPRQPLDVLPPYVRIADADPFATDALSSHELMAPDDQPITVRSATTTHADWLDVRWDADAQTATIHCKPDAAVRELENRGAATLETGHGKAQIPYHFQFRRVARIAWSEATSTKGSTGAAPRRRVEFQNLGTAPVELRGVSVAGADEAGARIVRLPKCPVELAPGDSAAVEIEFDYHKRGPAKRQVTVTAAAGAQSAALDTVVEVEGRPRVHLAYVVPWMLVGAVCTALAAGAGALIPSWVPGLRALGQSTGSIKLILGQTVLAIVALAVAVQVAWFVFAFMDGPKGGLRKHLAHAWLVGAGAAVAGIVMTVLALIVTVIGGLILAIFVGAAAAEAVGAWVVAFAQAMTVCAVLGFGIGGCTKDSEAELHLEGTHWGLWLFLGFAAATVPLAPAMRGMFQNQTHTYALYSIFGLIVGLGTGAGVGRIAAHSRWLNQTPLKAHQLLGLLVVTAASAAVLLAGKPTRQIGAASRVNANREREALRLRARHLYERSQWEQLIPVCEKLLEGGTYDVAGHNKLGCALMHLRRYGEAEAHLRRAFAAAPDAADKALFSYNIACTCALAGRRREAVVAVGHALEFARRADREGLTEGRETRYRRKMPTDPDLKSIHRDRQFQALIRGR